MNRHTHRKLLYGTSVITLMGIMSIQAVAQDAARTENGGTVLQPIVVTGERVTRSIQGTSSSVVVLTSDSIEKKVDAAHVYDIVREVPNIIFTDTVSAPIIRGMDGQGSNFGAGAFFGGTVPRARTILDGHNLSFWESVFGSASIWDVDSVEVFRGPQTTTQGANSIAGAIVVNTKDPTFTPEGAAQVQYGSRHNRRASLALSGAIVPDELAARVAVDYSGRDTFIDYVNPRYNRGETNPDFEDFSGRVKLLWQPAELPELESKLTISRTQSNRPTSEAASIPYDELNTRTLAMPTYDSRVWTAVHDISYDLDDDVKLSNRLHYSNGHTRRVAEPFSNGGATIDYEDVSNEIRVNFGSEESEFSGLAGIYVNRVTSHDLLYTRGKSEFDEINLWMSDYKPLTLEIKPA